MRESIIDRHERTRSSESTASGSDEDATGANPDYRGLVFTNTFSAYEPFTVVNHLRQRATVDTLRVDEDTVPEVSSPDDWTGHVIRYANRNGVAGVTTVLFLRRARLETGTTAQFTVNTSVYSPQLNVLEAPIVLADDPEPDPDSEEPVTGADPDLDESAAVEDSDPETDDGLRIVELSDDDDAGDS